MKLTSEQISSFLPQRDRFLLIDGAEAFFPLDQPDHLFAEKALHAWWEIPADSWAVEGHFPGRPLVPGVLVTEAMAQSCGLLARCFDIETRDRDVLLVAVDNARFLQPVRVPNRIDLWPRLQKVRKSIWKFFVQAKIGDQLVATCEIVVRVLDEKESLPLEMLDEAM